MKRFEFLFAGHGPVLATRDMGRRLGREVVDGVQSDHQVVVLVFEGIDVASPSFLDELVDHVLPVASRKQRGYIVAWAGLNEDVEDALGYVLERRGLPGLSRADGDTVERVLGGTRHLQETLEAARELTQFTARELSERLQLKQPAVHARLKALREAGAIALAPSDSATPAEYLVATPPPSHRSADSLTS